MSDLEFLLAQPLQAAKKMEKELRLQIERLQEDNNYNDQMYREVIHAKNVLFQETAEYIEHA